MIFSSSNGFQESHRKEIEQLNKVNAMALRMAKQEHTQVVVDLQHKVEDAILDEVSARVRPLLPEQLCSDPTAALHRPRFAALACAV